MKEFIYFSTMCYVVFTLCVLVTQSYNSERPKSWQHCAANNTNQ